jgi:hypothetical protein
MPKTKEEIREYKARKARESYAANPGRHKAAVERSNQAHPETRRDYLLDHREETNQSAASWRDRNPIKVMLISAKERARKYGIPFRLTDADISIPEVCPVLGVPMMRGSGDCAPSLDRIVPSLGYVPGNVVVVSWRANRIKSDASLIEMKKVVEFYEQLASGGK